jgi:Fic family protein
MKIEAAKEKVALLPVNPTVIASLRETAKLYTTHYSTMIEGNQLKPEEIKRPVGLQGHFPGRERDEHEVKGHHCRPSSDSNNDAAQNHPVTEKVIQTLRALVMTDGRIRIKPTPFTETDKTLSKTAAQGQSSICLQKPKMCQDLCAI